MVKRIAAAIAKTASNRYLIAGKYTEIEAEGCNSAESLPLCRCLEGTFVMKIHIGAGLLLAAGVVMAQTAQNPADTPESHVALAQTAAGDDYQNLFSFMCAAPGQRGGARGT